MNKYGNSFSNGGATLLQIIFLILKLCRVIEWSWLWVLSPTWITVLLVLVIAIYFHLRY